MICHIAPQSKDSRFVDMIRNYQSSTCICSIAPEKIDQIVSSVFAKVAQSSCDRKELRVAAWRNSPYVRVTI